MFSKNPNRSNAILKANVNAVMTLPQPTTQQLSDMLRQASQRVAELEARLQQLEMCIYVSPAGDVEISSAAQIRIVAGVRVEIQGDHSVEIAGSQRVKLRDQNGNSVDLSSPGITTLASAKYETIASTVTTSAGIMTVAAGMSRFTGTVQCDTIIANSVVGSSYTPGAGNVW